MRGTTLLLHLGSVCRLDRRLAASLLFLQLHCTANIWKHFILFRKHNNLCNYVKFFIYTVLVQNSNAGNFSVIKRRMLFFYFYLGQENYIKFKTYLEVSNNKLEFILTIYLNFHRWKILIVKISFLRLFFNFYSKQDF